MQWTRKFASEIYWPLKTGNTIKSVANSRIFSIYGFYDCQTSWAVFSLTCVNCKKIVIGTSTQAVGRKIVEVLQSWGHAGHEVRYIQACRPWGCQGCPPIFGRSVNPISTKGGRLCLPIIILAPPNFQTFRRPWQGGPKFVRILRKWTF